mgnify:CR=1 FL=1
MSNDVRSVFVRKTLGRTRFVRAKHAHGTIYGPYCILQIIYML